MNFHPSRLPGLLLVLLCLGYALGAAVGWGSPELALFMGDFGLAGAALAAALSCLLHACAAGGPARPAWLLFGLSSLMVAVGNGTWGWYEVVLGTTLPQGSPAEYAFLLFAPLAIIGLTVLAQRPRTAAGWLCLLLDGWLVAGSLFTLSWSLALGRVAAGEGQDPLRMALNLAYPVLDILLVSLVVGLRFRGRDGNRAAVHTAMVGLAVTVVCDALFTSPELRSSYHSGELLDAGWFAGERAAGLGALGHPRPVRPEPGAPLGRRCPAPPGLVHLQRAHPVRRGGGLHRGDPLQRARRPRAGPGGGGRGLHGRPGADRPAGRDTPRQPLAGAGTRPQGGALPLPGAGLQRRDHDRRMAAACSPTSAPPRSASTAGTRRSWSAGTCSTWCTPRTSTGCCARSVG